MKQFEFYEKLKESEKGQEYLDLLENSRTMVYPKTVKTEVHHKYPRCLGGTWDRDNLVKVSVLNHVKAHYLLAIIFGEKYPETLSTFEDCVKSRSSRLTKQDKIILERLEGWSDLRAQGSQCHGQCSEETKKEILEIRKRKWERIRNSQRKL